ncbi:MAG TPA: DUF4126 domain-containing protein [Verrucomicrobiaceae bacterium]|jgi:hypothetical protein
MDILAQLGVALGLASLAGVNLYLTVLITGLTIRFNFLQLASSYHSLDVLAHPVVLVVAGILFAMQFLADKIPWVDSLWDSVHTVIRPVGGTLLALQALGTMPGYVKVAAALLAGGAALTTHSAKAATRLLINHSPEPVTNVAMSLAEEAGVAGGVALTLLKPVLALVIFSAVIVVIWMIYPRLWRLSRTTMWLAWHKLKLPGRMTDADPRVELQSEVNRELRDWLQVGAGLNEHDVAWTVACHTGKGKGVRGLCANLSGVLVAPSRPGCVYFAGLKGWRSRVFKVPLDEGAKVEVASKFLSENVLINHNGLRAVFRFPREQFATAEAVARHLGKMASSKEAPPPPLEKPPISQTASPVAVPVRIHLTTPPDTPRAVTPAVPMVEPLIPPVELPSLTESSSAVASSPVPPPAAAEREATPGEGGREGIPPLPSIN